MSCTTASVSKPGNVQVHRDKRSRCVSLVNGSMAFRAADTDMAAGYIAEPSSLETVEFTFDIIGMRPSSQTSIFSRSTGIAEEIRCSRKLRRFLDVASNTWSSVDGHHMTLLIATAMGTAIDKAFSFRASPSRQSPCGSRSGWSQLHPHRCRMRVDTAYGPLTSFLRSHRSHNYRNRCHNSRNTWIAPAKD